MFTVICGVTLVAAVKNLELNSYLESMELYWWFVWPNFDVLCGSLCRFWLCVCSRGLVHLQWRKTQSWIQESKVWVVRRQSTLLNRPTRLHQRLIHQWIILEAQVADFTLQTHSHPKAIQIIIQPICLHNAESLTNLLKIQQIMMVVSRFETIWETLWALLSC